MTKYPMRKRCCILKTALALDNWPATVLKLLTREVNKHLTSYNTMFCWKTLSPGSCVNDMLNVNLNFIPFRQLIPQLHAPNRIIYPPCHEYHSGTTWGIWQRLSHGLRTPQIPSQSICEMQWKRGWNKVHNPHGTWRTYCHCAGVLVSGMAGHPQRSPVHLLTAQRYSRAMKRINTILRMWFQCGWSVQ